MGPGESPTFVSMQLSAWAISRSRNVCWVCFASESTSRQCKVLVASGTSWILLEEPSICVKESLEDGIKFICRSLRIVGVCLFLGGCLVSREKARKGAKLLEGGSHIKILSLPNLRLPTHPKLAQRHQYASTPGTSAQNGREHLRRDRNRGHDVRLSAPNLPLPLPVRRPLRNRHRGPERQRRHCRLSKLQPDDPSYL
jgi:hypothetical protein